AHHPLLAQGGRHPLEAVGGTEELGHHLRIGPLLQLEEAVVQDLQVLLALADEEGPFFVAHACWSPSAAVTASPASSRAWRRASSEISRSVLSRRAKSTTRISSSSSRAMPVTACRSEEHTSELQSRENLVCRLLLEK